MTSHTNVNGAARTAYSGTAAFRESRAMSTRVKIAVWCYLLGTLILTAFGIVYLVRPEFMPYHSVAVGMPWAAMTPPFQVLILALMRAVGAACLALAILEWTLLLIPFRRGAAWATWAIAG